MVNEALAQEITALLCRSVADHNEQGFYREPLVGFSAADDPLYRDIKTLIGPWHSYPWELLPEVKTVISFFIPFTRQVVEANRKAWPEPAREWVLSYHDCNRLIDDTGDSLVQYLREQGFAALNTSSTDNYDPERLIAGWSHRSAALVAGLGSLGLNRMLITAKGCAGRLGSVLTSAALPPGARAEREYCPYFVDGSCGFCVKNCPQQALSFEDKQDLQRRSCLEQCEKPTPHRSEPGGAQCCGKCVMGPCAYYE